MTDIPGSWWATSRKIALPLGFVILIGMVWEWSVARLQVSSAVMAAPSSVWEVLFAYSELLFKHSWPTAREALAGFGLATVTGITLGIVLAVLPVVRRGLYPHVVAFQLIPKVALAPLFILWFGIGSEARLMFVIFMAFFPIVVSTMSGISGTPAGALKLGQALGCSKWQELIHIRIPYAVPQISAGLKVSVTMAIIGTVVGEFVTGQEGLGFLIIMGSANGQSAVVFAAITFLSALGLMLFGLVAGANQYARKRWADTA
ncbi:MAG: ABC transporter permease [Burkholderiaceae bacterium]|nr:ABC transporter permease [Burkholderiaceae bacterium]